MPDLLSRKEEEKQAAMEAACGKQAHELYAEIGKLTTELGWLRKSWSVLKSISRKE
jgi:hypothetical protein